DEIDHVALMVVARQIRFHDVKRRHATPIYTTAKTRAGPPDAPSCFGPPTMIVAPAGGTRPRLARSSTAYLPAPSSARCATNFEAAAMSRLNVSTPAPTMSRSVARKRAASSLNP